MSANQVYKLVEKIEALHTKTLLLQEKNKKARAYYSDQEKKTQEKYEKELAYWRDASSKSWLSYLESQNELRDKHIELLSKLNTASDTVKGLEALKEVVDRIKGYEYKDWREAISLLKK